MKKVIIGIHGLGNKPPKYLLEKWWKAALLEGLSIIGESKSLPSYEMVYWADILNDKPLDLWEKNKDGGYYLDEPYIESPENYVPESHSFRQKLNDFISDQLNKIFLNDDKSLNYSFITNAILKKYFTDLEVYYTEECTDRYNISCKAKILIRERLVQTIKKYKNCEIMIIAHSMGSIVTYDVLNFLVPEINIHTLVTIGSPLGLPIVVSKIVEEQKLDFEGRSIVATPPGIAGGWFNFADLMDHVALNYKLADDFDKNENGIQPIDKLVNNNYEKEGDKNPHKSFGYLRTPELAKVLSDFIGEKKINVAQKLVNRIQNLFGN